MTLAIMQPTYLPWAGYFNLISRVQRFVFLNNVKIEKCSWHVRNRILLNGKVHFITVPTLGSRDQRIDEVQVNGNLWRQKHVKMLRQGYARHAYGPEVVDFVANVILDQSVSRLAELNTRLVSGLAERLGLTCLFSCASDVDTLGTRSLRLVELCRHFGEQAYLSPAGSRGYIDADRAFEQAGIPVEYQRFMPTRYLQGVSDDFAPGLSIVDVVANLGWGKASDYVRGIGQSGADTLAHHGPTANSQAASPLDARA